MNECMMDVLTNHGLNHESIVSEKPYRIIPTILTEPTRKHVARVILNFDNISPSLHHYLKNNIPLDTIPTFRIHLVNATARDCVEISCGIFCSHIIVIIQEKLDHSYPQDFSLYGVVS